MNDELREGVARIKAMERGETPPTGGDFLTNVQEATTPSGIDAASLDSRRTGRVNGGIACDVTRGPCRCGAWH
jgi:hypothetical protein